MGFEDVYGPVLDDAVIEDRIVELVRTWHHDYLAAAEHAADEQVGTNDRLRHWRVDDILRIEAEDVTPLLVCASPGEIEPPVDDLDAVSGTIRINLGVYCRTGTREDTRLMVRRYGWAVAALIDHKFAEIGPAFQLGSRPRKTYDELAVGVDFAIGVAYVTFNVDIDQIRSRFGGPDEPTPPEQTPSYPDTPTVVDVVIDVEPLDP